MVFQLLGGVSAASSIAAGAFGAHGLSKRLQELEAQGRNPFAPPRPVVTPAPAPAPARGGFFSSSSKASSSATHESAAPAPAAAAAAPGPTAHEVWSRAVAYHQLHSVALLLVPLLTPPASTVRTLAGGLFTSGICLFSGGLYGTVYLGEKKISQGAPFGGIAFILGWLALAVSKRPMMIR